MADEKSQTMDIVLKANSFSFDMVKNAVGKLMKMENIPPSLASKAAFLKITGVSQVDKVIKIGVAYKGGDLDEIGKAVFVSVYGLAGGAVGGVVGKVGDCFIRILL